MGKDNPEGGRARWMLQGSVCPQRRQSICIGLAWLSSFILGPQRPTFQLQVPASSHTDVKAALHLPDTEVLLNFRV